MSKFYQRYLAGLRSTGQAASNIAKPVDPTAMTPSHTSRPIAGKPPPPPPTSSQESSLPPSNPTTTTSGPARRVQIFTSSETYAPDQRPLTVFDKTEAAKTFLRKAIGNHYLFEALGVSDLNRIIDCMRPTFASTDESIIRQGELGDLFFCLETGTATATVHGKEVMKYTSGGCFGELALIYNSPRAASVIATSACKLWTLDLRTFRAILATTATSEMVTRCEFLKKCAFLDPLSNEQISKLAGALDTITFDDGDYIVRQGDVADSFFIIETGSVECTQIKANGKEVPLLTLHTGDYFGEMALMLNDTRHANCIARGPVKCLTLDRSRFLLLLGGVQDVLAKRMRVRILQSVPLLSKLNETKLGKLSSVMRVQAFTDGSYIIRQGEEGSRFYIINEGEVRCTRNIGSGIDMKEEELVRLTSQEFFGERALITNETRKANVIACGHVECLVLERSSFQSLLADVQDDIVDVIQKRDTATSATTPSVNTTESEITSTPSGPVTNIPFEELVILRTIGTGTFGRVKLIQHGNMAAALKCMNKSEVLESHQEKNIMAEKNLLYECSASPFVLKLLQTYNHTNQIFMLMEFVQGGELWSYIYERTDVISRSPAGGFELSAARFYAANVILAFEHLHQRGIAYRDLKPENLLLSDRGYLKMIDFGFAKRFPYLQNKSTNGTTENSTPGQMMDKAFTLCGTPEYLAPEIVMSKGYDKAVDLWALGCLIYELYLARTPFQADYTTKIFQNIIASESVLSFPRGMDSSHVALIQKLLIVNPAFRLGNVSGGIDDIKKDAFFQNFDWDALVRQEMVTPYVPTVTNALDASNFDQYEEEEHIPIYHESQDIFAGF